MKVKTNKQTKKCNNSNNQANKQLINNGLVIRTQKSISPSTCLSISLWLLGLPSVCPTWTSNRWDNCCAFWCLWQLPALVTKTTGNRKLLFWSRSFRNARRAAGITEPPRSRTPSTSKRMPTWCRQTGETETPLHYLHIFTVRGQ